MPRRVYTYPVGLGWDALNLVSTIGAFMIAAGVALFLFDLARNFRHQRRRTTPATSGTPARSNGCRTAITRPAASGRREPRAALGPAGLAQESRRAAGTCPARSRRRETLVTEPDRRPAAVRPADAATGLGAVPGRRVHRGVLSAAHREARAARGVCGIIAIGSMRAGAGADPGRRARRSTSAAASAFRSTATGPATHSWWAMILHPGRPLPSMACLFFVLLPVDRHAAGVAGGANIRRFAGAALLPAEQRCAGIANFRGLESPM